jgi:hypothetical protein
MLRDPVGVNIGFVPQFFDPDGVVFLDSSGDIFFLDPYGVFGNCLSLQFKYPIFVKGQRIIHPWSNIA